MSSLITGPSIWNSMGGDASLSSRIGVLENKYVRTTRFEIISGTTGSVTLPTSSTVVLDDFGGTVDAIISTASGGLPLFANAVDAGSAIVTTSFDSSGNYVLSAAPTAPQYCIIYRVEQLLVNFDSTASNIIGIPTIATGSGGGSTSPGGSNTQVQFNDSSSFNGDAGFTYNKTTDVATIGGLNLSGLTASQLTATDASKNLQSLSTATYPSLTELSYVKGATSNIQTQINSIGGGGADDSIHYLFMGAS